MYRYFFIYALVFLLSFCLTAVTESRLIPFLSRRARQPIYEDGPRWHAKKNGTPTMGGLAFISAITLSCAIALPFLFKGGLREEGISLLLLLAFAAFNSAIGIIDDATKLHRHKNAGLTPKQKLLFQTLISIGFLLGRKFLLGDTTAISFSFGEIDIGFFYYPLAIILLLGIVNCANLTDGIDGLAACVSFAVGISFFYISAYLAEGVAVISASLIGAMIGFLIFNLHPARIFMGDTGSLFLGAVCVGMAFSLKNPILVITVCGVYVIEGISVILQVLFYKSTKRRLFKMAPIHHHLEKCGLSENTICIIAILLTLLLSVPAYVLYLP